MFGRNGNSKNDSKKDKGYQPGYFSKNGMPTSGSILSGDVFALWEPLLASEKMQILADVYMTANMETEEHRNIRRAIETILFAPRTSMEELSGGRMNGWLSIYGRWKWFSPSVGHGLKYFDADMFLRVLRSNTYSETESTDIVNIALDVFLKKYSSGEKTMEESVSDTLSVVDFWFSNVSTDIFQSFASLVSIFTSSNTVFGARPDLLERFLESVYSEIDRTADYSRFIFVCETIEQKIWREDRGSRVNSGSVVYDDPCKKELQRLYST